MPSVPDSEVEWITYDELTGPALEPGLWEPLDFGSGPRVEPGAHTTVEGGAVTVDIARFTACDATNQGLDNTKHVIFTTRGFRVPADGVARFSAELRSEVRDESGDYRQGFASFNVVDTSAGTHQVYNILSTGERVFAEQELLAGHATEEPFCRVVEDPFFFARRGRHPDGDYRRCTVEIDRAGGHVAYRVDDHTLHVVAGLRQLPDEVHMAFGIFTLLPIGEGNGSAHGQGGKASWRNIRYSTTP